MSVLTSRLKVARLVSGRAPLTSEPRFVSCVQRGKQAGDAGRPSCPPSTQSAAQPCLSVRYRSPSRTAARPQLVEPCLLRLLHERRGHVLAPTPPRQAGEAPPGRGLPEDRVPRGTGRSSTLEAAATGGGAGCRVPSTPKGVPWSGPRPSRPCGPPRSPAAQPRRAEKPTFLPQLPQEAGARPWPHTGKEGQVRASDFCLGPTARTHPVAPCETLCLCGPPQELHSRTGTARAQNGGAVSGCVQKAKLQNVRGQPCQDPIFHLPVPDCGLTFISSSLASWAFGPLGPRCPGSPTLVTGTGIPGGVSEPLHHPGSTALAAPDRLSASRFPPDAQCGHPASRFS
ncbi:uncharacterized protein LOC130830480 [Hippopotamus amphibius kiboko]|uniref:uncharacterized protein LOC130830480 n=1 Tax=Hippopotamus amphibius kiboko TaxID=575201 RepID=UPI00259A1588|nr:uncharacterized protein LOC130830480 [Hippopotamus amphibius kiboko]